MKTDSSLLPCRWTLAIWSSALICCFFLSSARAENLPPESWEKLPPHPRLFATASQWERLRTTVQTDPTAKALYTLIRERAENTLTLSSLDLPKAGDHLHGPMRQMQGRLASLAMAYRLSSDARFLTRARQEMRELATTPHWRPGHFLSNAEATLAMAIGLDWLWNDLPPEERSQFTAAIIEKGLRPSDEEERKKSSWITSGGNWNPVCHGAMAAGAITIAEHAPDMARRIVDRSIAHVGYATAHYAPAGAHSEGPGYWAYGTNFYVILIEALRTAFGTSCDLEKAPGFLRTGDYNIQMTTPTGHMFSYADSVPDFGFEPAMFWFAREISRPYLATPTLDRLSSIHDMLVSDTAQPDASRLQALALLWWDPALTTREATPVPGPLTWWSEGGPQPQAVMRSAWHDPRAAYVGFKAGIANEGHAHMDLGSFLYEVNGVRWAVDLGRDSYAGPRRYGLGDDLFNAKQESKRWSLFRVGPESHNILRFNGAVPWVDGRCEMRPAPNTPAAFLIDLTPAYSGQIVKTQRGVSLRPGGKLLVRDEWTTGVHAAAVTWQWLTYADVALEKSGATLTEKNETLKLQILSPAQAHIAVEDVSRAPNPWDSPNPGLKRIIIRVGCAATTDGALVVLASPVESVPAEAIEDDIMMRPLSQW